MTAPLNTMPSPAPAKQIVRGAADRVLAAPREAMTPAVMNTRAPAEPGRRAGQQQRRVTAAARHGSGERHGGENHAQAEGDRQAQPGAPPEP